MRRHASILVLALSTFSFSQYLPKPEPVGEISEAEFARRLKLIERDIEAKRKEMQVPGLAVVIVKDDKPVLMRGFGYRDLVARKPVTPDTMFMIASCSKAFTSMAVLMGVEEGKIKLGDSPRKYLPYFSLKDPEANRRLTVADLMCHRSGLSRVDVPWISAVLGEQDTIEALADAEPTFLYGENQQYSNILVHTAGAVAAAAYKRPFEALVQERIFDPLGMKASTYKPVSQINPDLMSKGYWFDPRDKQAKLDPTIDCSAIPGAGAIKSSVKEMAQWLRLHLNGGEVDGKRLISSGVLKEAYKPRISSSDLDTVGLGWYMGTRFGTLEIRHGGYLPGFQSHVCFYPEKKLGFVVLTNNAGLNADSAVRTIITKHLIGKPDSKWEERYSKDAGVLVDWTGEHLLRLTPRGSSMWAILDQGKPIRLTRIGEATYKTADPRNPQMTISCEKGHAVVESGQLKRTFARKRDPLMEVMAPNVMSLAYQAAGESTKPVSFVGRYTRRNVNEGTWGAGLICRTLPGEWGFLELQFSGDQKLFVEAVGTSKSSSASAADFYREEPILGNALRAEQQAALATHPKDWRSMYSSALPIARVQVGGERCWVIEKTPHQGPKVLDFVSEKTNLVIRRELGSGPDVWLFSDYRSVGGVQLPHRMTFIDGSFKKSDFVIEQYKAQERYPRWAYHVLPFPPKK